MHVRLVAVLMLVGSLVVAQERVSVQAPEPPEPKQVSELQPADETSVPPRVTKQTRPKYPRAAFDQKIQGEVVIEFMIDTKGRVAQTRVIQSVPGLDEAAVECLRKWRFKPALKNGKPVAVIARAPVVFKIF
jgi:TonB family protein